MRATTRPPTPTEAPSSLPDLVVESTRITIPGFTGGCLNGGSTSLKLEVCIANHGTDAAAFNMIVNGAHFARVRGIGANETACVYGPYSYPDESTIFLDDENEIAESDEDNNIITRFVPIPTLPPTCAATPTATPIVTVAPSCAGDCDGNGRVSVNELVLMVSIALDRSALDTCPHYEEWLCRDVCVDVISVIVEAVNHALRGCGET